MASLKLSKQYVRKEQLDALGRDIELRRASLEQAKFIAKGGPEGLKKALDYFKQYRTWLENKIDDNYRNISFGRMFKNAELAGQKWALTLAISTFETPKEEIARRSEELQQLENQLSEWKKLPVRE